MRVLSSIAPVEETAIDRYLADQADLTAVERFSQRHARTSVSVQARYYQDLIPLEKPDPGQQYGFEVDLDACTGCKACVAACHSLNGLDDDESWRSVTLLRGAPTAPPFQQTVTGACHHCVDPACLAGCPVDAYEKDPITGIVSHLDDQCIGCGYCTLSCPYEVPVFNHGRGIVRKCDMCKDRLSAGEAPACVQGCPNGAIAITMVDVSTARVAAMTGALVPGLPPSSITVPTTRYVSAKGNMADGAATTAIGQARAHPPLAVMLVLTQLSVGAFTTDLVLRLVNGRGTGLAQTVDVVVAAAMGVLALAASVLHLGRPRYFYRTVIGLSHSWLSREVVAFGAFTSLAVPYALLLWLGPSVNVRLTTAVGAAVAGAGVAGVACSVLTYTTTHRASWRPATVGMKFGLTAAVGGLATVTWASLVAAAVSGRPSPGGTSVLPLLGAGLVVIKLGAETAWTGTPHPLLCQMLTRRRLFGLSGGVVLPLLLAASRGRPSWTAVTVATLALVGLMVGEFLERSLFFTTASPPR